MRRKLFHGIAVAAVAVTVAGGVAGCGVVDQLSAKQKVSKAVSSFQDADSATFTMKLDSDVASIKAISTADGEPLSADDQKVVEQILAGDVQYSVHAADGKKLADTAYSTTKVPDLNALLQDPARFSAYLKQVGDISFAVHLKGDALVELRFKDGLVYARAAVPKIVELAGEDPAVIDRELAGLPPALAPLQKAAKGEWVSIDIAALVASAKDSGALDDLPTSAPTPSLNATAVQKLIDDLKVAYEQKVTITELPETDRGQQYRLSAPAKQIAAAVQDDLIALVGDSSASEVKKFIAAVPDQRVTTNVWVKDDELTGIAIDLTQFLDHKPTQLVKFALDIAVDLNSGDIETPSGTTALDVAALLEEATTAFSQSLGAGLGSAGAEDFTFEDFENEDLVING